jgi:hypothetical protein
MRRDRPRPSPAPPADPEGARADRRTRALEESLDIRLRPDARFVRLEVRNPVHRTRYDVLLPAYPARDGAFCTCTDFARRGIGTCKHLEAAWIWAGPHGGEIAEARASTGRDPGWEEVDRRSRALPKLRLPWPLRIRYAGDALRTAAPLEL